MPEFMHFNSVHVSPVLRNRAVVFPIFSNKNS
jgi:hypothetical protein